MDERTPDRIPGDPALYNACVAAFLERRRRLLAADPALERRVALAEWRAACGRFVAAMDEIAAGFAAAMEPLSVVVSELSRS